MTCPRLLRSDSGVTELPDLGSLTHAQEDALILALWASFNIAQSRSGALGKAIWIVLVLFLPFFGFVIWLFFGPRTAK